MYWLDDGSLAVIRSDLDGLNEQSLVSYAQVFTGFEVALDIANGHLYWIESGGGGGIVSRADLDGSNATELPAGSFAIPSDMALDLVNGHIYYVDAGQNAIYRSDVDGLNRITLFSQVGDINPFGIALDPDSQHLYFTDDAAGNVYRADLDGSNIVELVSGIGTPLHIELDLQFSQMYWVDDSTDEILRANLDGSAVTSIASTNGAPLDLALNLFDEQIYFTAASMIRRVDFDGANVIDISSGVPRAIALPEPRGLLGIAAGAVLLGFLRARVGIRTDRCRR
jgi:DNA-binding beta-propeller fold protein YncE